MELERGDASGLGLDSGVGKVSGVAVGDGVGLAGGVGETAGDGLAVGSGVGSGGIEAGRPAADPCDHAELGMARQTDAAQPRLMKSRVICIVRVVAVKNRVRKLEKQTGLISVGKRT